MILGVTILAICMVCAIYQVYTSPEADHWRAYSKLPVVTVNATVVSTARRRLSRSSSREPRGGEYYYFATFRLDDGEELELSLILHEGHYRKLKGGERGCLSYRGNRYLGFEKWDNQFDK